MVEHSDEKTRRNYTESLEREKELQTSLLVLGESHANVAKSLSTLHEQHGQINTKYADSRLAESLARKRVEELEEISTRLKIDNAGMKSLLASNEQAFSRKLQALEEDIETMRTGLEGAHKELSASKIGEQDARSQVQALLQEKEDILKNNVTLERDLALRIQSLEEARARNQALEQQLNDEKHSLEEARTEGYQSMGRLAEKDQSTSAQIQALNTALESHREREGSLIGEIATLNALVSTLRERAKEGDEAEAEYRALEKALSKKHVEMGRVEVENSQLQSQVVQLELARDAINEQIRQLRESGCVARERETAAQKELQELRRSLKEHHDAGEKASVKIARMEGEVEQLKAALENEKDAHRVAEKQRETALLSLSKIQAEQKSVLDKASATEKKLRSSTDGSQERIKKLEIECEERENELKRLRYELNASNTAKATLESLVSEFKNSVQQARSQREKIEAQEGRLATLSNQVSTQETELRLLEHQLANANARLSESRADTNAHRAAAESARASAALIEGQLKRKEQDIEAIRSELQSRQLPQTDTTADAGSTSVLQNKIEEQEGAIKNLKSQVLELEKSSETIVERYKDGKLTNREKDLVGVITAGIVQEKNRTINNLKGELKRKENEIETHKITVANLKDSLAKQIKQTIDLKEQLEPNGPKDPAGRQPFSDKNMTVSSSPLSDRSQAPDHDPPAPDSPAVHLTERPMQNSRAHDQVQQYNPGQPTRAKPPARTLAPIRLESGNATDEIQDFEEPKTPQDAASTGRKRGIVNIEPLADGNQEEAEHETQRKTRAKKDNKLAGEGNGSKGQSNKADGTSTTKGKAAKRRKF
ncbi:unnamed protein product [Rhizoctonia solani]|uniref:Uncharacterized protein n=1 Tax=Rhizoctonia solani TaxID=456999 RepID=A0A8H3DWS7_9AGAM|nr:unnamed protein product [Rhizoctonia solani]